MTEPHNLDTYWIVFASDGQTSERLNTLPDVATWIEDKVDPTKVHSISVKRQKFDRKKVVKEVEAEMQRVERRMNALNAKLVGLKNGK